MKLIIAGGRAYRLSAIDIAALDQLSIGEVVSGGAPGVDRDGETFARDRGLLLTVFPADWQTHGRAAGPIRNRQMAAYADAVALFPGGRGTASMQREALAAGLQIFDFRYLPGNG